MPSSYSGGGGGGGTIIGGATTQIDILTTVTAQAAYTLSTSPKTASKVIVLVENFANMAYGSTINDANGSGYTVSGTTLTFSDEVVAGFGDGGAKIIAFYETA